MEDKHCDYMIYQRENSKLWLFKLPDLIKGTQRIELKTGITHMWCVIDYYALFRLLAAILFRMCYSHILFNTQDTFNFYLYV